jgi:DNA ligase-1
VIAFAEVARLAEDLAGESSRLKKRAAIASAVERLAAVSTVEAGRFCLYVAGQPFAEDDARKLNAGGALLSRALKEVSRCTDAELAAAYRRHGDLGAAAYDLLTSHGVVVCSDVRCQDDCDTSSSGGGAFAQSCASGSEVSAEANAG